MWVMVTVCVCTIVVCMMVCIDRGREVVLGDGLVLVEVVWVLPFVYFTSKNILFTIFAFLHLYTNTILLNIPASIFQFSLE